MCFCCCSLWYYQSFMKNQEENIELQKKVHGGSFLRDITFLTARPSSFVVFCRFFGLIGFYEEEACSCLKPVEIFIINFQLYYQVCYWIFFGWKSLFQFFVTAVHSIMPPALKQVIFKILWKSKARKFIFCKVSNHKDCNTIIDIPKAFESSI